MALSIRKSWAELGNPQQPGHYSVRGVGKILDVTHEHIARARELGENALVLLSYVETDSLIANWKIEHIAEA